jgi:peptidoglycan/LPS O-acetylase OafA/YrhL
MSDILSQTGHFGVIGFFVLSGFIMQSVYADRDWNIKSFAANRFARIYPIYLCGLLLALPIDWFTPNMPSENRPQALGLSVLLLQAWAEFANGRFNGPGWTLSVEAFFYAMFPLLFYILRRSPLLFGGLFIGVASCTGFLWEAGESYRFPANRLWEFMAGMIGAKVLHLWPHKQSGLPWWFALMVLTVSFFCGCAFMFGVGSNFAGWLVMVIGCWLSILILGNGDLNIGRANPLSSRVMVLGGEISYGLYIFHDPIQRYCKVAMERMMSLQLEQSSILVKALYFGTTTIASLAVAYLGWILIENPSRVYLRKLLGGGDGK